MVYHLTLRLTLLLVLLINRVIAQPPDSCYVKIVDDYYMFMSNVYEGYFKFQHDSSKCDLFEGLYLIGKNYHNKYPNGEKSTFYFHTLRGQTTKSYQRKPVDPFSSYSQPDSIYSQFLPSFMFKLYFISAVYHENFGFRKRVLLGYDTNRSILPVQIRDHDYPVKKKTYRQNNKILKDARKSLYQWLDLLELHGIEYLRKEGISPLSFSKLKWL